MTSAIAMAVVLALAGCASGVGEPKPGAPAHHRQHGFANVDQSHAHASGWTRWTFFMTRVLATTFARRTASLPVIADAAGALRAAGDGPTVTWVGHSTLLVRLDGVNLLTDPQWSPRASPVRFAGPRRLNEPGLPFEALPPIHVVLISHDHYDHLDVDTVRRLAETHRPRFLVPLGLKAWFADLGITDVEELDWWDAREIRGLVLTCVPAQHFSGRTLWDRNRRLWSGWAVTGRSKRLFFAGDTGYFGAFHEIGRRLGPFDLAAIPIGAYLPPQIMKASHTDPAEALQVLQDIGAAQMLAIHWGTFDLAEEEITDPPRRLEEERARRGIAPERVWVPKHGETRPW